MRRPAGCSTLWRLASPTSATSPSSSSTRREMQPRCSRDAAEMQPRCSRDLEPRSRAAGPSPSSSSDEAGPHTRLPAVSTPDCEQPLFTPPTQADRMLDLGFEPQLRRMAAQLLPQRQTHPSLVGDRHDPSRNRLGTSPAGRPSSSRRPGRERSPPSHPPATPSGHHQRLLVRDATPGRISRPHHPPRRRAHRAGGCRACHAQCCALCGIRV